MTCFRLFPLLFFLLFPGISSARQSPHGIDSLADTLAVYGYRDISVSTGEDTLFVSYRPMEYRDEYIAFRDVGARAEAFLVSAGYSGICYISCIQTAWGVPLIHSTIDRETADTEFYRGYVSRTLREKRVAHPARPVLFQFDIPLRANFGNYGDPLVFRTGIRPGVRIRVKPGLVAYVQVDIYLHNEYDPHMWYNPMGAGILYLRPLTRSMLSVTNIGAFQKELYGIDQMVRLSLWSDRITFGLHGGVYGSLRFKDNRFIYTDMNWRMLLVRAAWTYAPYDCMVSVKGGRFVYGDTGFGGEITRVFREFEIGAGAVRSGCDTIANISVRIPLAPKKRKMNSRYGIGLGRDFRTTYTFYSPQENNNPKSTIQKAVEPESGISLTELERLATPMHFTSRLYRDSF